MGSVLTLRAQTPPVSGPEQTSTQIAAALTSGSATHRSMGDASGWHAREGRYFQRNWGVDIVDVRRVSSGEMLAFRYIVLDPEKASGLNDKRNTAYLIDEKTGVKLMVPQMEKVGALRTTATPVAGRMYWMVFANTGRIVDAGSKVDVVIGDLHVDGLTVEFK
jgi:hypothetical protein